MYRLSLHYIQTIDLCKIEFLTTRAVMKIENIVSRLSLLYIQTVDLCKIEFLTTRATVKRENIFSRKLRKAQKLSKLSHKSFLFLCSILPIFYIILYKKQILKYITILYISV